MEPLAASLRPQTLDDFVGQSKLVGNNAPLRKLIENKKPISFLLWGPPGSGKTTLARIYAKSLDAKLYELSAVSAGKSDLRSIIEEDTVQQKILFLDEIHRFNKAQQDFLLPYVEDGQLLLIGATTENPSFEVNNALLSRLVVFTLTSLDDSEITELVTKHFPDTKSDAIELLIRYSDGDVRRLYSIVQLVQTTYQDLSLENIKLAIANQPINYDQKGEQHYNLISAFIKSMRASQPNAALYYLARMLEGGEDPRFIARRMMIFASEDIGNAQPTALVVANAVFDAVTKIGLPEAQINLSQGVIYLANAKKDKSAYNAIKSARKLVQKTGNLDIPLNILNAPTKLMKDLGYGQDYKPYTNEDLLPESIKNTKFI